MERLQKKIAESGYASRRKAEELIKAGKVYVNDILVTELGTKVSDKDIIRINDKVLEKEKKEYYILNKPRGYVSTTKDELGRKSVIELIDTKARIYPVGRLDYDTTGLLLLTNDGDFANRIMHPSHEIEKSYIAKLNGIITPSVLMRLKEGVEVDGVLLKAKKAKLKKVNDNSSIVQIVITDGKNHQIKNMFESVGLLVDKFKREREGIFTLDKLASGEYRKLTKEEIMSVLSQKYKIKKSGK